MRVLLPASTWPKTKQENFRILISKFKIDLKFCISISDSKKKLLVLGFIDQTVHNHFQTHQWPLNWEEFFLSVVCDIPYVLQRATDEKIIYILSHKKHKGKEITTSKNVSETWSFSICFLFACLWSVSVSFSGELHVT